MGQYYNLCCKKTIGVEEDGFTPIEEYFSISVLVNKSEQYDPYTRHLSISQSGKNRISELEEKHELNHERWFCDLPTPYHPRVVFE
jgi:hypothetical protein